MLRPIDNWFLQQEEPIRGCLEFLRQHILNFHPDVTESWQYSMPFFKYKEKRFCYLWYHREKRLPYLGIVDGKLVDHPDLIAEKRSRMKILLLDPEKDLPLKKIDAILNIAIRVKGR